jgi:prophage regulatory protein
VTGRPIKIIGNISRFHLNTARRTAAKFADAPVPGKDRPPVFRETFAKPVLPDGRKRRANRPKTDADMSDEPEKSPSSAIIAPRVLLTFSDLKSKHNIPYTRRHIDRLEADGKFPKRVPVGEQRVAWVASEIEAFVEALIAKRSESLGTIGSNPGVSRPRNRRGSNH